jgi:hypothetical protein
MLEQYRYFLKDSIRLTIDFSATDQNRGVPAPPLEKPASPDAQRFRLTKAGSWKGIDPVSVEEAIAGRRSRRVYSGEALTLDELSFLLWATQGVRGPVSDRHAYRTVPSAGCRHAFETYMACFRVAGLEKALYRYLPLSHELVMVSAPENLEVLVARAALHHPLPGRARSRLSGRPFRPEWNGGMGLRRIRSLPWMPDTSVRISISPAKRSVPGPARSLPTTRRGWTGCLGWTGRRSSPSTWPR